MNFMHQLHSTYFPFLARLFMGGLFVWAGAQQLIGFAGTVQFIESVGLPAPTIATLISVVTHIVAGLALIVGYKTRWAAYWLGVFTIAVTLIFHTNFSDPVQAILFAKNLALLGGLMYMASYGAGSWSLDQRMSRPVSSIAA